MPDAKTARFDDLSALESMISDEFGQWGKPLTVSQTMIDQFAQLSGDRQWIHVDVERAKKESPLQTTIAHGLLILALIPSINPQRNQFHFTGYKSAVVYGTGETRFLSPVVAGSRIHARCRLCKVQQHRSGVLTTFQIAVHILESEKPSLICEMKLLYR
jgi:acyl dehydratase